MTNALLKGKINSFQSLGTLDGPGVRFVVFMQGCNLRCSCCHNPDTWNINEGKLFSASEIIEKAIRFREYFGVDGGITISGGEPLLQSDFCFEVFKLSHENNINTCLDTSGSILNDSVKKLLSITDKVLLDIKYTENSLYQKHVGCDIKKVLLFLDYLSSKNIPTTIRQVIIPTVNDSIENIKRLKDIVKKHDCVDKIELLPFKNICQVKYDNLKIKFPFKDIPLPTDETMSKLNKILQSNF